MVSLFSLWVLRGFNLLRHISVVLAKTSFCDCLSYNPFNRTFVLFTTVFLTWYDLSPYSIVLPILISALGLSTFENLLKLYSFRDIYVGFTNMSFCERSSYNPFNRTSVLFNVVSLSCYDLTSYSNVLPISISALIFDFGVFGLGLLFSKCPFRLITGFYSFCS